MPQRPTSIPETVEWLEEHLPPNTIHLLRGAKEGVATVEVDGREVALVVNDIDKARLVPDL